MKIDRAPLTHEERLILSLFKLRRYVREYISDQKADNRCFKEFKSYKKKYKVLTFRDLEKDFATRLYK